MTQRPILRNTFSGTRPRCEDPDHQVEKEDGREIALQTRWLHATRQGIFRLIWTVVILLIVGGISTWKMMTPTDGEVNPLLLIVSIVSLGVAILCMFALILDWRAYRTIQDELQTIQAKLLRKLELERQLHGLTQLQLDFLEASIAAGKNCATIVQMLRHMKDMDGLGHLKYLREQLGSHLVVEAMGDDFFTAFDEDIDNFWMSPELVHLAYDRLRPQQSFRKKPKEAAGALDTVGVY